MRPASCSAKGSSGNVNKGWGEKEAYPPAGTSLQEFAHRYNYSCKSVLVGKYLQELS